MRDVKRLQKDPPAGVSGAPTDNILLWDAIICGPAGTPFEDGTFQLTMEFTGTCGFNFKLKKKQLNFLSVAVNLKIFEI